jgi:alanine racemase
MPHFSRRALLGGALAATAAPALAAPVLSADRYDLSPAATRRWNAWIEIDADQYERNIAEIRRYIDPKRTDLCAVLKGDAYGHGVELLTPTVIAAGVRTIGVTHNEEARIARRLGFKGRIIRLRTPLVEEVEDAHGLNMEELLGNAEEVERLSRLRPGGRPLPFHLGLNCDGMSRNGIELKTAEGKADARRILAARGLRIVGLMTHYPTEDLDDMGRQLARFQGDSDWLRGEGLDLTGVTRHTANSVATAKFPAAHLDMVRVGSFLVGDTEAPWLQFKPILTLKTRVAAINHYPAGETVNYDRTFKLGRDSWLANLPLGYSDGFRRTFSHANQPGLGPEDANRTEVLIGGRRYPLVGRVTMNTVMVDVTDGRDRVRPGDEVVLLGRQGAETITYEEVARNGDLYSTDYYTVLGHSVPRILASAG